MHSNGPLHQVVVLLYDYVLTFGMEVSFLSLATISVWLLGQVEFIWKQKIGLVSIALKAIDAVLTSLTREKYYSY
jgi:hypothetical protein